MGSASRPASLVALAVLISGFAGTAQADFLIRIDNYLNPSAYSAAASNDEVEVCVHTDSIDQANDCVQFAVDVWQCKTKVLDTISEAHDFIFDGVGGIHDRWQITDVHISINGSDLLIIDRWGMEDIDWNYTEFEWVGAENDSGYCLSTDSGDFTNSHCWSGFNSSLLTWSFDPQPSYFCLN